MENNNFGINGVQNTKNLTLDNVLLHVLAYGSLGNGHTDLGSSFPEPFLASFDTRVATLIGTKIPYKYYMNFYDFQKDLVTMLEQPIIPFKTLIIDSYSTMQKSLLNSVTALTGGAQVKATIGKEITYTTPTMQDYGLVISIIIDLMMKLQQCPFHTLLLAHEETIKNDMTGMIYTRPLSVGKDLGSNLGSYCDEVWHLKMGVGLDGNATYNIRTVGTSTEIAKTSLKCLPTIIDITHKKNEPNKGFDIVMEYVKGVRKE